METNKNMTPESLIGREAVAILKLAGYEIEHRPAPSKTISRYTCPHCKYSALGGRVENVFAEWGKWWHNLCVPYPPGFYQTEFKPMIVTQEPRI